MVDTVLFAMYMAFAGICCSLLTSPPSYHPRPLPPPPRGPRENPPPRCGPRPRPPPLGGGGPRGRGGLGERARWLLFPENVDRPREGPLGGGSPPRLDPTPLANLILPRVLPRGAGTGRPRPRDTRDIISSSSGDGAGDHPLFLPRDEAWLGGRLSRGGMTVLRFVIMSGSIPFRVNDDDFVVAARKLVAGQSPTRCFALQQLAQQIETVTWSEWRSLIGNLHRESHSASRCSFPQ